MKTRSMGELSKLELEEDYIVQSWNTFNETANILQGNKTITFWRRSIYQKKKKSLSDKINKVPHNYKEPESSNS